ncbi:hypothetical protein HMPREF2738_02681 [Clostridiales bacterium KLE1615]|nr:hypothetical protein HMPREF2738_02681 [Clostridiales bacterium KLE1615]
MFFFIIHYFERPASSVRLVKSIHLRALPQYLLIHELQLILRYSIKRKEYFLFLSNGI